VRHGHRAALGALVAAFALLFFGEGAALPTAWLPLEEAPVVQHARGDASAHDSGSVLYPAVIAPFVRSASPPTAYKIARALSALFWALTVIPAFALARRLVPTRAALLVAALSVLVPGAVYATAALPDSLGVLLAVSSLALAARGNVAPALAVAVAAAFARPWFVVLAPALLVASEWPRGGSFLRWPRSLVFAAYAVFAYFLLAHTAPQIGSSLTAPGAAARAALASVVVAVVGTAVVPWLLAATVRPSEAILLRTCLPALVVAAGVFGAAESGVDERPLLALVPLVLALAARAWLVERPSLRAVAPAAVAVALAAAALPALGRVPLAHAAGLSLFAPGGASRATLALGTVVTVAIALVLLAIPRRAVVVPSVVALALVGAHAAAWTTDRAETRAIERSDPAPHGWVDEHAGAKAEVYAVGPAGAYDARTIAELELWNRSVRGSRVLDLTNIDPKSGYTNVTDTPVVLVRGAELTGTELARSDAGTLLQAPQPLQVAETVEGLYPDGWSTAEVTYRRFGGAPQPGKLLITSSRADWTGTDVPSDVFYQVGPLNGKLAESKEREKLHAGGTLHGVVEVPPAPFLVNVFYEPTFSPSQFGQSDTRQLGAKVTFHYEAQK
jgi:hypothetical protein